jgi:hypothetical protein
MSKSNYLQSKVLGYWLKNESVAQPSQVFLGILYNASSLTDANVGTSEIPTGNYSATDGNGAVTGGNRPEIVFGSVTSNNQIQGPTSDIEYDNTSGSQMIVSGFGVYTAATGGELLYWGDLTSSKTIEAGDSIRFEASTSITITED